MMWYMCRGLFHIGFEVDFFVLLVNQLLGPLSSYITSFRAKYPILLANKSVIVLLSIGAGSLNNEKTSNHNKGSCQLNLWVLSAVPSVPSIPAVPSVPAVPNVPSVPAVPSVPSVPSVPAVLSVYRLYLVYECTECT